MYQIALKYRLHSYINKYFSTKPVIPTKYYAVYTKRDFNKDKVKEDFIVGFNIVTLKDGNKVIVEKGASGEIKIRDDLPVY